MRNWPKASQADRLTASAPKLDPASLAYPDALGALPARVKTLDKGKLASKTILLVAPIVRGRKLQTPAGWESGTQLRVRLQNAIPPAQTSWMMLDETDDLTTPMLYVHSAEPVR